MKTKQQYYTENRYYVAHSIALVILIACAIHLGKNGFSWGWLFTVIIPIAIFVLSWFQLDTAYRRYVDQEIDKTNWASTRTDMINTEEDD